MVTEVGSHAALIAELEQAKEGSPKLDVAVYAALDHDLIVPIPKCTRSLDAAVDLVPESMKWGVDCLEAWVGQGDDEDSWGHAKTPAISLCIAVLKAMEPGDG